MTDFKVGDTLYEHFSTRAFGTGIPTTLIGTPVAEAYEDANATGITAGVSLTIDHGETGHHLLTVVATGGNGFETGKFYGVSLTAGTVDGVSVVGEIIFNFSLEKSAAAQDLANGTDGLGAIKDETALILADTVEIGTAGAGLTAIPATVDWLNGGRLDLILDIIAADVANIDGAAMRGTDSALLAASAPTNFGDMSITVTTGLIDITQTAADKVWGTAARILTASTNFNDLSAAEVNAEADTALVDFFTSAATLVDLVWDEPIEDHDTQGNVGWAMALAAYPGSDGPGIYVDSGAANTNTVVGMDGTEINPVSTPAAARTLADALGVKIFYLEGNADITLDATYLDWEFIGIGSVADNVINLGSQDVSRSLFRNLTIEGTQGGTGRITARDCALQDPGAGDTMLHIFAERCGFVDRIQVDTSADNVFDQCYSLVAGTSSPVIQATGAAGTISVRHYSGGMEFETLSASHNVTWEGVGQVIFNADCNVNANVSVRGIGAITDNTAGMLSLTETSLVNMTKINTECDTALTDYDPPTRTEATSDKDEIITDLDDIKGTAFVKDTHSLIDIKTETVLIAADTNELQSDDVPGLIAALNDIAAADVWTHTLTEGYAADGAAFTAEQGLYMLWALEHEFVITGTTISSKKLDSTEAMTHTMDDAADPTQRIRAT